MNKVNKCLLVMIVSGIIFTNYAAESREFDNEIIAIHIQEPSEIQKEYDALQKMYEILVHISTELRNLKNQYDFTEGTDEKLKKEIMQFSMQYLSLKKLYEGRLTTYNDLIAEQQIDVEDEFDELE